MFQPLVYHNTLKLSPVALLFPPVTSRGRFLIHKTVEEYFPELGSVSIDQGVDRRTLVTWSRLIQKQQEKSRVADTVDVHPKDISEVPNSVDSEYIKSEIGAKTHQETTTSDTHCKQNKRKSKSDPFSKLEHQDISNMVMDNIEHQEPRRVSRESAQIYRPPRARGSQRPDSRNGPVDERRPQPEGQQEYLKSFKEIHQSISNKCPQISQHESPNYSPKDKGPRIRTRPDKQLYVPRGRRSHHGSTTPQPNEDNYQGRPISPANSICSVASEFSGRNRYNINRNINMAPKIYEEWGSPSNGVTDSKNESSYLIEKCLNQNDDQNQLSYMNPVSPKSSPSPRHNGRRNDQYKENFQNPHDTYPKRRNNRNRNSQARDHSRDSNLSRRNSCSNLSGDSPQSPRSKSDAPRMPNRNNESPRYQNYYNATPKGYREPRYQHGPPRGRNTNYRSPEQPRDFERPASSFEYNNMRSVPSPSPPSNYYSPHKPPSGVRNTPEVVQQEKVASRVFTPSTTANPPVESPKQSPYTIEQPSPKAWSPKSAPEPIVRQATPSPIKKQPEPVTPERVETVTVEVSSPANEEASISATLPTVLPEESIKELTTVTSALTVKQIKLESPRWADCDDSWEGLFDEAGELKESQVEKELKKVIAAKVKVQSPSSNYQDFKPDPVSPSDSRYANVIEIYDFPSNFQTQDILSVFNDCKNIEIKWVDDTHALGVFETELAAADKLNFKHPFVKTRPFSMASGSAKTKALRSTEGLLPYKARPVTSAAMARRLVTGALGLKVNVDRDVRAAEKQKIKDAKDRRRRVAKQKEDAWEGTIENQAGM